MNKDQGFELISQAAGVHVKAWGKTVNELFCNCLHAMASLMKPSVLTSGVKVKKVKQLLRVEAVDINTLLAAFVLKIIGLSDIHNLIFTHVTFKRIGDNFLEGELSGVAAQDIEREPKGIVYDEVDVTRDPKSGLYKTKFLLDL